jgi:hypothetical protein
MHYKLEHLQNITVEYKICPALSHHPLLDLVPAHTNISLGYLWLCRLEYTVFNSILGNLQ